MSKLTIVANINHRHIFQHEKFIRNVMSIVFFYILQVRNISYHYPITWLAFKIFAVICLEYIKIIIASGDKSSKFNSFASTLVVLPFHAFSGTNFSLMNEGNIFCEFYFPIRTSIRENKNLAKIYTYTVCHDVFLMHLHQNAGMHFKTCYNITSILEAGTSLFPKSTLVLETKTLKWFHITHLFSIKLVWIIYSLHFQHLP